MLASAAALLTAALFSASPRPIVFLTTVQTSNPGDELESGLHTDLEQALRERPQLSSPLGAKVERQRVLACGASTDCLAAIAREGGGELALRVTVDRRFTPALYGLELIDALEHVVLARAVGEQRRGEWLRGIVTTQAKEMLDAAGYPPRARLRLQVQPPDAELRIEPTPETGGPLEFLVPPGDYRISAVRPGYTPADARVAVTAGRASDVTITLASEERAVPTWVWIGLGAAGALAAGTAVGLLIGRAPCGICLAPPGEPCLCPE